MTNPLFEIGQKVTLNKKKCKDVGWDNLHLYPFTLTIINIIKADWNTYLYEFAEIGEHISEYYLESIKDTDLIDSSEYESIIKFNLNNTKEFLSRLSDRDLILYTLHDYVFYSQHYNILTPVPSIESLNITIDGKVVKYVKTMGHITIFETEDETRYSENHIKIDDLTRIVIFFINNS